MSPLVHSPIMDGYRITSSDSDRPREVIAELVGTPSPADSITIAVGYPGGPAGMVRLEYPMAMVDRHRARML